MSEAAAARYVMGHNDRERRRLLLQASVINPITDQLFRRAGIGPGMKVLDIGSGMGDVALISARLGAQVTAVDLDAAALAVASERAHAEGLDIRCVTSDVYTLDLPHTFDAVTGRHILIHLPDPRALLRDALRFLKPGGMMVFQEYDFDVIHPAWPPAPLRERTSQIFRDFFAKAVKGNMGTQLFQVFTDAGLVSLDFRVEYPIAGPGSPYYEIFAEAVRSILPRAAAMGIEAAADLDIDTLEQRLRDEAIANGSFYPMPAMVGGYGSKVTVTSDPNRL